MQVLNVAGLEQRLLYNLCKAYVNQLQRGEHYYLLTNVVAVTVTDFVMFSELADQINRFVLRADDNPAVTFGDLSLVFAELPKFHKQEEQLENVVDKWFYFLKYAGSLEMIPKTLEMDPAIKKAFELANKAALTPEELNDQERREMFIQDQRGAITYAEQRGRQEGRQEGRHEERASMLTRQLQRRFGDLPTWASQQIADADLSTLEEWSLRILDATTLDSVLADPS
jgi:predicted transposase/invertase (TIGR01784 family)